MRAWLCYQKPEKYLEAAEIEGAVSLMHQCGQDQSKWTMLLISMVLNLAFNIRLKLFLCMNGHPLYEEGSALLNEASSLVSVLPVMHQ